jgi:hypothetical protein
MLISVETRLDDQVLGLERATCPHCDLEQDLEARKLEGTVMGVLPLPAGRALLCPTCKGVSRREGRTVRIFSALFLVPFGIVLGVGIGAGQWMIASSLLEGIFEVTYLVIAALLICGAGYLGYRVLGSARSLLVDRRLLPLNRALQTEF